MKPAPPMPREFKGRCTGREVSCGICLRRYGFRPGLTPAQTRGMARDMGWTYRDDLGWVCPCRHHCEGLKPDKRKEATTRTGRDRSSHAPAPAQPRARIQRIIRRRNRNEGE